MRYKLSLLWILITWVLLVACDSDSQTPIPETGDEATTSVAEAVVEEEAAPTEDAGSQAEATSEPEPTAEPGLPGCADLPAAGMRAFVLDAEASQASYTVEEEFFSGALQPLNIPPGHNTAIGTTSTLEGCIQFALTEDGSSIEAGDSLIVVDISTLTSDQWRRDDRIREQHLESERFPLAQFVPMAVEGWPAGYSEGQPVMFQLVGEFSVRRSTRTVTFDVEATLSGGQLSGTATAIILMTDYGFAPPGIATVLQTENEVLVTLDFVAHEVADS